MMKPTLVVLAAGMGSRYGGLKQIDPVGPNGEWLLDYSIYDALRAGFGKVVFIIRRDIENAFRGGVGERFARRIAVEYAFQELDDLADGFQPPAARMKPWGTGHAVLAARRLVKEPFAVINADDFYGAESFRRLGEFLARPPGENEYAMVGYRLEHTVSPHGAVSRGLCEVDDGGWLKRVIERAAISFDPGVGYSFREDGNKVELTGKELASMNIWGFTASIFASLERLFSAFLAKRGAEEKSEFFLPGAVDELIAAGEARVSVLHAGEKWYGVTYPEDRPVVAEGIRSLIAEGRYPARLWE